MENRSGNGGYGNNGGGSGYHRGSGSRLFPTSNNGQYGHSEHSSNYNRRSGGGDRDRRDNYNSGGSYQNCQQYQNQQSERQPIRPEGTNISSEAMRKLIKETLPSDDEDEVDNKKAPSGRGQSVLNDGTAVGISASPAITFDCASCLNIVTINPWNCDEGHSICGRCATICGLNNKKCPQIISTVGSYHFCGSNIAPIKIKQLIEYFEELAVYACDNVDCKATVKGGLRYNDHKKDKCSYENKSVSCQLCPSKSNKILINAYAEHLTQSGHHNAKYFYGSNKSFNIRYNENSVTGSKSAIVYQCFKETFVVVRQDLGTKYAIFAFLVSKDEKLASQFRIRFGVGEQPITSVINPEVTQVHTVNKSLSDLILGEQFSLIRKEPESRSVLKLDINGNKFWNLEIGIEKRDEKGIWHIWIDNNVSKMGSGSMGSQSKPIEANRALKMNNQQLSNQRIDPWRPEEPVLQYRQPKMGNEQRQPERMGKFDKLRSEQPLSQQRERQPANGNENEQIGQFALPSRHQDEPLLQQRPFKMDNWQNCPPQSACESRNEKWPKDYELLKLGSVRGVEPQQRQSKTDIGWDDQQRGGNGKDWNSRNTRGVQSNVDFNQAVQRPTQIKEVVSQPAIFKPVLLDGEEPWEDDYTVTSDVNAKPDSTIVESVPTVNGDVEMNARFSKTISTTLTAKRIDYDPNTGEIKIQKKQEETVKLQPVSSEIKEAESLSPNAESVEVETETSPTYDWTYPPIAEEIKIPEAVPKTVHDLTAVKSLLLDQIKISSERQAKLKANYMQRDDFYKSLL